MFNMNYMINMLKNISNPQAFLSNQLKSNPSLNALLNQINNSGLNPRDFALQYFKQNNVDITPIINMFANNGVKL